MTEPTVSARASAAVPATEMPSSANQSIGVNLAAVLRERVVTAVYPPGEWIRESVLAKEFGYSNGPIREALQLLVSEGLLVRETWRGVRVVELTGKQIIEIFQLRMALLALAAELAAHHMDAAQLTMGQHLLQQVETAKAAGDIDEQMVLGSKLSLWLCEGSGNVRLASDWSRLTSQTRMYIYASLRATANHPSIHEQEPWREVIAAIESHDPDAARIAARHLMQRTLKGLELDAGM